MKKSRSAIPVIVLMIIVSGCSTLNRYRGRQSQGSNDSLVNIELFGFQLSDQKAAFAGKTLWDLNADAQSQLLKIYNSRYPGNDSFLNSLNNEYLVGKATPADMDYTRKNLRMVFSVSKSRKPVDDIPGTMRNFSAADRIEYLKITLFIRDPYLKFTGWNLFSTEYGTIDLANVSSTRSLELKGSASVSASTGEEDADKKETSVSGTASLSRKEELALKSRYLKLNGQLNDSVIALEEEGTREIDLTGNIVADVSLKFNRRPAMLTKIYGLKDSSGKYNPPQKLKIENNMAFIPGTDTIVRKIEADLTMDYVYRKVLSGRRTYQEWDDIIKYYSGHVSKKVTILRDYDYVPGFYGMGAVNNNSKNFVNMVVLPSDTIPLSFESYKDVTAFKEWLMQYFKNKPDESVKLGEYQLVFRHKYLTGSLITGFNNFGILPVFW